MWYTSSTYISFIHNQIMGQLNKACSNIYKPESSLSSPNMHCKKSSTIRGNPWRRKTVDSHPKSYFSFEMSGFSCGDHLLCLAKILSLHLDILFFVLPANNNICSYIYQPCRIKISDYLLLRMILNN